MRPMAAPAFQTDVLVSWIHNFIPDGMRRMRLPLMARFAELQGRRLIQQEQVVGAMGGMAFSALPLRNRRMLCRGPFLPSQRIGVTLTAHDQHRLLQ